MRKCPKCKEEKEYILFNKNKNRTDGCSVWCKKCFYFYNKEYRKLHKEELKNKRSAYNKTEAGRLSRNKREKKFLDLHPEFTLYHNSKMRARKAGLEHTITKKDIIIPDKCPILDIPLKKNNDKCGYNSPSLDRIDNTKGYTKDNIIIVSMKVNTIKNNATIEEIEKIYKFYKQLIDKKEKDNE